TPAIAAALTGPRKPLALPAAFDHDRVLELFTDSPEAFLAGEAATVTADPARRPVTRKNFVDAHFRPGARPAGHGFSAQNRLAGTPSTAHDPPAARLIALAPPCRAGGADGCLDRQQARWLAERLAEVHSAYVGPDGRAVSTGHEDRLAIVFSHHGTDSLTNNRHPGPGGEPLLGGAAVGRPLHRLPNAVLWLNRHTHVHPARPP